MEKLFLFFDHGTGFFALNETGSQICWSSGSIGSGRETMQDPRHKGDWERFIENVKKCHPKSEFYFPSQPGDQKLIEVVTRWANDKSNSEEDTRVCKSALTRISNHTYFSAQYLFKPA